MKDRLPPEEKVAVVYRILCGECQHVHIGQTARTLKHRVEEHKRSLKNLVSDASALAEHACHKVQWSGASVVEIESRNLQCQLLESWHIGCEPTTMNREVGLCLLFIGQFCLLSVDQPPTSMILYMQMDRNAIVYVISFIACMCMYNLL